MPDILRDPVWQFIGAVFAILAFAFGLFLYWKQRQRKELSYEFILRVPLVSVWEALKGRVKILFDDQPVQSIYLVAVRILNSGNLPIISADYERPVSLCFSENTTVVSAGVSETKPKSLQAVIKIEGKKVVLAPVLLNGGDSITLSVLVDRFDQPSVDGRIVGVNDIRELERKSEVIPAALAFPLFFMFTAALLIELVAIVFIKPLHLLTTSSSGWDGIVLGMFISTMVWLAVSAVLAVRAVIGR